jgi:phospholipid/cholesterol/gamma-HCH transport system permease protein
MPADHRFSARAGHCVAESCGVAADLVRGTAALFTATRLPPVVWRQMGLQFKFTALDAIPFTILMSVTTALALVVQITAVGLQDTQYLGSLLTAVVVRELGPLLAAVVVVARSGAAIAAELANMRVSGEERSLRLAGIDPFTYLVVPRLGGVALAMVCVGQLLIFTTLAATHLLLNWMAGMTISLGDYLHLLGQSLSAGDLVLVGLKLLVPGMIIAAITSRLGRLCPAELTSVPPTVSKAVVRSVVVVLLWDAMMTWIWVSR